jgi:hypothetical protein
VRWLDALGKPIDLHRELRKAGERIDCPIWIACKGRSPLAMRLIAVRKPRTAADAARRQARQQGRKSGYTPSRKTLHAAGWFIVVTSLPVKQYSTDDVLALYRLRWRIELAFKRNRGKSSGTGAFFSCADSSPWTLYIMCCRHAPFLR